MNYEIEAIKVLTNYAEFTIFDGDLENINYHTDVQNKPTIAEILAKAEELQNDRLTQIENNLHAKADLLAKLGITEDEAKLLLG